MRFLLGLIALTLSGCHVAGTGCQGRPSTCGAKCGGICGNTICCEGNKLHWRWWDKVQTKSEARSLARRELKQLNRKSLCCDFQYGFEQAFEDVAMGACGDVPPLPPALYWKVENRTPQGHQRAQEWFSGYAVGAARAKAIYEPFNEVGSTGIADLGCPPGDPRWIGNATVP